MSLDELITAATKLNETELDEFVQQIVALRPQRKANVLPSVEAQLLDQINQNVLIDLQAQYDLLRAKREAETLAEEEHEQLIELSKRIEQFGADRLEASIKLALLLQISLKKQQANSQSQALDEMVTETEALGLYEP